MNRRKFVMRVGQVVVAVSVVLTCSLSEGQQSVAVLIAYHSATGNTEKMTQGVAEGAKAVAGTSVILKRVAEVAGSDLTPTDALIVGSPVYFGNMSGEVKTFFDNWGLTSKFDLFRERKMRNKIGAAFATGGGISNGKEVTLLSILAAMLVNQMIVVGGGGAFGASATTGPDSPGIDDKEMAEARDLGKRVRKSQLWLSEGQASEARDLAALAFMRDELLKRGTPATSLRAYEKWNGYPPSRRLAHCSGV